MPRTDYWNLVEQVDFDRLGEELTKYQSYLSAVFYSEEDMDEEYELRIAQSMCRVEAMRAELKEWFDIERGGQR